MHLPFETQQNIKRALGKKAASLVKEGQLIGLGTGSTASFFIQHLIERCQEGLNISVVSSSNRSLQLAKEGGIPTRDMAEVTHIDLTIDGADEIDPNWNMIKGGGGALVREKILATSSQEMVVIVDESKLKKELGAFGLPVEIVPFGHKATIYKLENKGYQGTLRTSPEGEVYVTDNGNYIFDIHSPNRYPYPEGEHVTIVQTPGVVDTGLFFGTATSVLVGYSDGRVELQTKR